MENETLTKRDHSLIIYPFFLGCVNMSMLQKTKILAVKIAKEHTVSEENQKRIENLIDDAFSAYAEAWKGGHSRAETRQKWEYLYNELTENRNHMEKALSSLLKYSDLENEWTANFKQVIEIILGTKPAN